MCPLWPGPPDTPRPRRALWINADAAQRPEARYRHDRARLPPALELVIPRSDVAQALAAVTGGSTLSVVPVSGAD
jgi:hypothetical protein